MKTASIKIPYRASTLMSSNNFCRYCLDYGINITVEDLEGLHKAKLLIPAIRIELGVIEYLRIKVRKEGKSEWIYIPLQNLDKFKSETEEVDERKYYSTGCLCYGNEEDLKWYQERRMLVIPSQKKFSPWKKQPYNKMHTPNIKEVSGMYAYLYDRTQFFILKILFGEKPVCYFLKNLPKEKILKIFIERIKKFYKFINSYFDAEKLYEKEKTNNLKRFRKFKEINEGDAKEAEKDWYSNFKAIQFPKLSKRAKSVLKKHNISVEEIKIWMEFLSKQNIFYGLRYSPAVIRNYILGVDEKILRKVEPANNMIFILNEFMYLLTGKEGTVKEVIGDIPKNTCPHCYSQFKPRNRNQKTCGNPGCTRKERNKNKRKKKTLGIYS